MDNLKLTPQDIDNTIRSVHYHRFPNTTVTVCCVTLNNGFNVIGHSACVSEENFNSEVGSKIAFDNAKDKIWELEGYLLKQKVNDLQLDREARELLSEII